MNMIADEFEQISGYIKLYEDGVISPEYALIKIRDITNHAKDDKKILELAKVF